MDVALSYLDLVSPDSVSLGRNLYPNAGNARGLLRHDVDHDLHAALRMASVEAAHGIAANYYLLPTADYWESPFLVAAAQELQALGHAVGLHNNTLSQWMIGEVRCPYEALLDQLDRLRTAGVSVQSVSSHGDRLCYQFGFNNSWLFEHCWNGASLRGEWVNLSAEGVPDSRSEYHIAAPVEKVLRRPDGQQTDLGATSLEACGLLTDVSCLPGAINVSDSGGTWHRGSPDLLRRETGPVSMLLHPEYWVRDEEEMVLVLASARSGTKWLRGLLAGCTESRVTHEYILNNPKSAHGPEHLTSAGIAMLDPETTIRPALVAAQEEFDAIGNGSWIEVNVYLPHYLDMVATELHQTRIIALFRHPRAVVASLMRRGWFETVVDVNHVQPEVDRWADLTQFERVCHYVEQVNMGLLASCRDAIRLEDLTKSPERFQAVMAEAGVRCSPPGLAEFSREVDASGPVMDFSAQQEEDFARILGDMCSSLGYALAGSVKRPLSIHAAAARRAGEFTRAPIGPFFDAVRARATLLPVNMKKSIRVGIGQDGKVKPRFAKAHTHIVIGGSTWTEMKKESGWAAEDQSEYVVQLDVAFTSAQPVSLLLLEFVERVRERPARRLLRLRGGEQSVMFRCSSATTRFDLVVYASAGASSLTVSRCDLWRYPSNTVPSSVTLLAPTNPQLKT